MSLLLLLGGGVAQEVSPSGIASEEAFGVPSVTLGEPSTDPPPSSTDGRQSFVLRVGGGGISRN